MNDRFDFRGGQLVNQPGMNVAGPRPAADIGDALVINRNHHNLVRRPAVAAGTGQIVKAPLQTAEKVC